MEEMHKSNPVEDEVQKAIQESLMMNTEEAQLQRVLSQSMEEMYKPNLVEDEVEKVTQESLMMNAEEAQLQRVLSQSQTEYDEQQDANAIMENDVQAALAMSMQVNHNRLKEAPLPCPKVFFFCFRASGFQGKKKVKGK